MSILGECRSGTIAPLQVWTFVIVTAAVHPSLSQHAIRAPNALPRNFATEDYTDLCANQQAKLDIRRFAGIFRKFQKSRRRRLR